MGCFSYHRGVVSSAGLDALGISAATPDPPGGRIERDTTGEPTGLLIEAAWTQAHAASLAGYTDPDRWGDLIVDRARALLAEGITAVHDAACPPEAEEVYRRLHRERRMPISVLVMPHGPILAGPDADRLQQGPGTGEGDEWLRVGPVKLFADGGIELDIDAHLGERHVRLEGAFPQLPEQVAAVVAAGYGVAIHAMGNAGLRRAIAAWQEATRFRSPHHPCRIEHVTLAGRREIADLRSAGTRPAGRSGRPRR